MAEPMIRKRKVSDYVPDPHNANKGTERGQYMVDTSVQSVGLARSIVAANDDTIPAGNKTLQAAMDAGIEDVIEVETDGNALVVVKRTDWATVDSEKARQYAYLDNRASEVGLAWDAEQVLRDLDAGVDLSGMFLDDELDELLAGMDGYGPQAGDDPGAQVDRAEELREKWQTERGQVWDVPSVTVPGRSHRVMCGDSLQNDWDYSLVCFCDPPYGIKYDPAWLDDVGTHRQALSSRDTLQNDDGNLDLSFLKQFERRMVWGFPYLADPIATGWIVWDKQPGVESRGIVTPIEMAYTTMRKGFDMVRVMWGGYYRDKGEDSQPHPTQKPIGVYKPFIEDWTKAGDTISDPFMGSGAVHVAAEQTGRICYGMELEPKYVAVTLERLAGMGLEPRLLDKNVKV